MNKRDFLKQTGLVVAMTGLGFSIESCGDDELPIDTTTINLSESPFDKLKNAGGWLLHPDKNILLINDADTIRAFSSVCTHQGCSRDWSHSSGFVCGCHGSQFSNSGRVIKGPASRSLTSLPLSVDNDIVTIA